MRTDLLHGKVGDIEIFVEPSQNSFDCARDLLNLMESVFKQNKKTVTEDGTGKGE